MYIKYRRAPQQARTVIEDEKSPGSVIPNESTDPQANRLMTPK